ncbi:hypothetical protein J2S19_000074 [Metabacillus malikii]|uniref:Uncharacterized protein n=1 Tax=Metabacillus malikii TaxID=1504265 RepID=A0ABT9Z990_9BACI|nr:hypothetical protein [Metabacillus malikii]
MDKGKYQVCATCIHFKVNKNKHKTNYICSRLNYETKSTYSFSCWNPKQKVLKLMEKRGVHIG